MKVKSMYPIIVSENPEKTMEFYATLGFTKKHDLITKMGTHVYVVANEDLEMEIMEAVSNGPAPITAGLYGFRMNVDDIDAAAETVKKNGGTIIAGPFEVETAKNLMVKDADGNNITMMQHIKK